MDEGRIIEILGRKSTIPSDDCSFDEIDDAYDRAIQIIKSYSQLKNLIDDNEDYKCKLVAYNQGRLDMLKEVDNAMSDFLHQEQVEYTDFESDDIAATCAAFTDLED